jgi:hypothetical protein
MLLLLLLLLLLLQKRHTLEFLRGIAHLRPRTNTIGAVSRVRSALAHATHTFFQGSGFHYVHTPILSASDCEGAGEMFQVSSECIRTWCEVKGVSCVVGGSCLYGKCLGWDRF